MNLKCLDCLAELQKKRKKVKECQADLLEEDEDKQNSLLAQFKEGQLNAFDWMIKRFQGKLNEE